MAYISNTEKEKKELLDAIGAGNFEDLVANVPKDARYRPPANGILKKGLSEMELLAHLRGLAARNQTTENLPSFLGAGAYRHFIPSAVGALISRGEFLTAYTPYQPEASQGTLQATFEFQTMVAELYGMDVANASLYDGASAVAEAAFLALRETGRQKVLVSSAVHPEYRQTLKTYAQNFEVVEVPCRDGVTDLDHLKSRCDPATAAVIVQSPNFFGAVEDGAKIAEIAHAQGALLAVSSNPLAMGLLAAPGDYGADIAVGEGQPLGIPLHYGGPYLGLFSCKQQFVRRMPGRICGMTKDGQGKRGYVLTLQTREQHIRREKATSNICTNEALMALAATVHLSLLGPQGLREVAELNVRKAHYAAAEIDKLTGFSLAFGAPFFNEFVVRSKISPEAVREALLDHGIIGGLPLGGFYPELADCALFCVTETNSKEQIDGLVKTLRNIKPEAEARSQAKVIGFSTR